MNNRLWRILVSIVIVSMLAAVVTNTGYALSRRYFVSLEEMLAESDSIVEVRKTRALVVEERYIPGELSEVEVLRVIKGDSDMLHKNIKVINLNGPNDKEEHFILMLQPAIVSYGEDVYGTIGIEDGILVVNDNGKVRYGGWTQLENGDKHPLAQAFDGVTLDRAIWIMHDPDLRGSSEPMISTEAAALSVFLLASMVLAVRYISASAKKPNSK